jgi:hypothetical protein
VISLRTWDQVMSSSKHPWWRAFDRVERAVGRPLEDAAASSRYVDVMLTGMKVQRAVGGAMFRVAGGTVGTVLRVATVPSRTDVRRLSRQLTVLTTEVRALAAAQHEDRVGAAASAGPRGRRSGTAPGRTPGAGSGGPQAATSISPGHPDGS